jgi:hypothetical protein
MDYHIGLLKTASVIMRDISGSISPQFFGEWFCSRIPIMLPAGEIIPRGTGVLHRLHIPNIKPDAGIVGMR